MIYSSFWSHYTISNFKCQALFFGLCQALFWPVAYGVLSMVSGAEAVKQNIIDFLIPQFHTMDEAWTKRPADEASSYVYNINKVNGVTGVITH